MEKFYLTAAIPYVNAKPHVGHALEFVEGDVIARYHQKLGEDVFYISGADENSLKNVQAAEKEGITVQELCDRNYKAFLKLGELYNVHFDRFERSSSPEHFASSQDLWERCEKAGDIYKKKYKGLYCVGCEAFYTPDELVDGECSHHPGKKVEVVEEENYFFRLSRYEQQIRKIIETNVYRIIPEKRKNEVLSFINQGLQDFSISRSKERARGWGVPVPGDPSQIMYVWFDALNVYRSAAPDWPASPERPQGGWPANLHIIGKDIIRFHAIYWPAILLSAKLPLPHELLVHGFITVDGQKMSKSLGNVIDPFELVERYGTDSARYFFLREIPFGEDGDFTYEKFEERYNADLANGLGNFAARVSTLAAKAGDLSLHLSEEVALWVKQTEQAVHKKLADYRLNEALMAIWELLALGDRYVNEKKVWEIKDKNEEKKALGDLVGILKAVGEFIEPFLPETGGKIKKAILGKEKVKVEVIKNLFPRIQK